MVWVTAMAQFRSLVLELLHATEAAKKRKKKNAKFTMYWLSSFVILSKSLDLSVSQLFQR